MRTLSERVGMVATEVAVVHAHEVDREARFPVETMAALKLAGALGAMVPKVCQGEGASLAEVANACQLLARACPSSGLIFAMHQIQVAGLARHGLESAWHRSFLERIAADQLLLGSATSEAGIGGDVRSSACAIEADSAGFRLEKQATVVSYGEQADALLVTARRGPGAPASDQVLTVLLRDGLRMTRTSGWDTLGMRGTCSFGYHLQGRGWPAQILPLAYADISAQTMLPVTHVLWSSVWLGIAADAAARAGAFVRGEARRAPGTTPPGAVPLAEAAVSLQQLRSIIQVALNDVETGFASGDPAGSLSFAVDMNMLKVGASRLAVEVVDQALLVCGLHGYRNDGDFSLARHLRDVRSAPLMIANDRILGNTARLLLASKATPGLQG
jgi:acyl-CoA dehydrogenase